MATNTDKGFNLLLKQIGKERPDKILDAVMETVDKEKQKAGWLKAAYIVLLKKLGY
jgi:hypothetical protein